VEKAFISCLGHGDKGGSAVARTERIERIKEQIKYETELLKAILLITIAIIGGTISLLLGDPSPLRAALEPGFWLVWWR
jgi:hypothetical protein